MDNKDKNKKVNIAAVVIGIALALLSIWGMIGTIVYYFNITITSEIESLGYVISFIGIGILLIICALISQRDK